MHVRILATSVVAVVLLTSQAIARELPDLASTAGLLKHGVSFGVAGLAISNAGLSNKLGHRVEQRDMGITIMPYLTLLPSYWARRKVRALYCASKALSLNDKTARASAEAYAKETHDVHWDPKTADACWKTGFGLYGGFPLGYQANFALQGLGVRERKAHARGSFGLVWAPSRYISILLGLARVAVSAPRPMGDSVLVHGWAYTIGVGAAFEIAMKVLRP